MAQTTLKKENAGYNYKYTDLAQINEWCEANGIRYSQEITIIDGNQYVSTKYTKDGKEYGPFLGAQVIKASPGGQVIKAAPGGQVIKAAPGGKVNEAQIYGSGLTYARRYSLLMCFGLATDDDDAQCYTGVPSAPAPTPKRNGTDGASAFLAMMQELENKSKITYDNWMIMHGYSKATDVPQEKRREVYQELKSTIELAITK